MPTDPTEPHLTLLGRPTRGPVDHVETFPAPPGCTRVVFSTDEVSSLCPVTGQPDVSSVRIDYVPNQRCVESKSLKLFLWGFRDREVFAETLAVRIDEEIRSAVDPAWLHVRVRQHVRGGIETETHAGDPEPDAPKVQPGAPKAQPGARKL